ncbi:MAG: methylmalonyl-CoA mutase family protein, partial [Pseudomonadota bacterium]
SIEYMKTRLVDANAARLNRIERGETTVVGVNRFTGGEASPLTGGDDDILVVDPAVEAEQIARLDDWRGARDADAVVEALTALTSAAQNGDNIMPPSIQAAKAGVTTGEWGAAMRAAFGEYRAPTGVGQSVSNATEGLDEVRADVDAGARKLGQQIRLLIGKPGLDGHSNGAEQIAVRARDCGMKVFYEGIRMTPEALVAAAVEAEVHVIGLSILSGSHMPLIEDVLRRVGPAGLGHVPIIVGGIIPEADEARLCALGVSKVYTPKDFDLNKIILDIVSLATESQARKTA